MLKISKRPGSPHWQITGTLRGIRVRETTGTADKEEAQRYCLRRQREILAGTAEAKRRTVADAIEAYIDNGGEDRYFLKIIDVMGDMPLDEITQEVIDRCSREAYGKYKRGKKGKTYCHKPSTIKRQFYDPLASAMHYAAEIGWTPYQRIKKKKVVMPPPVWAEPEWFSGLWKSCDDSLKALTMFLSLTGCRISECLSLDWKHVDLDRKTAFIYMKKTKTYRTVRLPGALMACLESIKGRGEGRVFSAYKNYDQFRDALEKACKAAGVPYMSSHKIGSHTFATWMRRYAGMDSRGLVDTGRWKSQQMAERYTHTDVSEESMKADILGKLFE
jgi:integrase